jgi:hypothetical protein
MSMPHDNRRVRRALGRALCVSVGRARIRHTGRRTIIDGSLVNGAGTPHGEEDAMRLLIAGMLFVAMLVWTWINS